MENVAQKLPSSPPETACYTLLLKVTCLALIWFDFVHLVCVLTFPLDGAVVSAGSRPVI